MLYVNNVNKISIDDKETTIKTSGTFLKFYHY